MHSPSGALELEDFADLPLILGCCDTGKITLGSSVVDLLWFSTRSKMKSSGSDGRSSVCPACSLIDIMLLPHASVLCLAFFILSNPSSRRFDRKQACSITIKDQIFIFQTGIRSCCIKSVSQPNSKIVLVDINRPIDTINRFSCHDDKHRSVIKQTNYLDFMKILDKFIVCPPVSPAFARIYNTTSVRMNKYIRYLIPTDST